MWAVLGFKNIVGKDQLDGLFQLKRAVTKCTMNFGITYNQLVKSNQQL